MSDFLRYLTMDFLLQGALLTLQLTAYSFGAGLLGGVVLAAVQLRRVPFLSTFVRAFVIVSRGTPVLLQLLFVYDVLPSSGIRLSAFTCAVIVLALNTSSYFSEVMRGAVTSLDRGQILAAESLGMTPFVVARRIIAPQAFRIALPSLANQVVVLILTSSLASIISVPELTLRSQEIASATFQVIAVYSASGLMYLVLTSAVAGVELVLEDLLSLDPYQRQHGFVNRWARLIRQLALGPILFGQPIRQWAAGKAAAVPDMTPSIEAGAAEPMSEMLLGGVDVRLTEAVLAGDHHGPSIAPHDASSNSLPMLTVDDLVKSYGDRPVLRGVSLSVHRGEVVVIMGVSGCGKSTLLRAILRLENFDSGSVQIEGLPFGVDADGKALHGRALAKARAGARVALVFQHFELFLHMSARDNVSAALRFVYGQQAEPSHARAVDLLDAVGLAEHAQQLPRHLSGGQQQRTAIARALAISPRLMLLDEPTSALDPLMVYEVLTVIRRLASLGMTMVIVTHEVEFARDVADRIIFMHEGQVVESGPPDVVLESPSQETTRTFLRILKK